MLVSCVFVADGEKTHLFHKMRFTNNAKGKLGAEQEKLQPFRRVQSGGQFRKGFRTVIRVFSAQPGKLADCLGIFFPVDVLDNPVNLTGIGRGVDVGFPLGKKGHKLIPLLFGELFGLGSVGEELLH